MFVIITVSGRYESDLHIFIAVEELHFGSILEFIINVIPDPFEIFIRVSSGFHGGFVHPAFHISAQVVFPYQSVEKAVEFMIAVRIDCLIEILFDECLKLIRV